MEIHTASLQGLERGLHYMARREVVFNWLAGEVVITWLGGMSYLRSREGKLSVNCWEGGCH